MEFYEYDIEKNRSHMLNGNSLLAIVVAGRESFAFSSIEQNSSRDRTIIVCDDWASKIREATVLLNCLNKVPIYVSHGNSCASLRVVLRWCRWGIVMNGARRPRARTASKRRKRTRVAQLLPAPSCSGSSSWSITAILESRKHVREQRSKRHIVVAVYARNNYFKNERE